MADPTIAAVDTKPRQWRGRWVEIPSWAFDEYVRRATARASETGSAAK